MPKNFNNSMEASQGPDKADHTFDTAFPPGKSAQKNIPIKSAKPPVALRRAPKAVIKSGKTPTPKKVVGKNYFLRKSPSTGTKTVRGDKITTSLV